MSITLPPRIRAISLHQPWATLVAIGAKQFETRSWSVCRRLQPGELLAIHATKQPVNKGFASLDLIRERETVRVMMRNGYDEETPIPTGKVLCICRYLDCLSTFDKRGISEREMLFGDWEDGRFAWQLEVVKRLSRPIRATGRQGLWWWDVPDELRSSL